jgi:flagellar hook-associated protein 2
LQTQQADNALFNVNGIDIVRGSNTVSDVIEGVTLKLTKGTPLDPASTVLTVGQDTGAVGSAVNAFVKAYNDALNALKTNSAFNAATQKGAILTGDSTVRSLQTQLSGLLQTVVTGVAGGIGSLADIGVTRQTNGTLTVDNTKLNAAINDPTKDVAALFAQTTPGNEGIAVRFKTMLSTATVAGGTIDNRTSGINASLQDIARSREAMNLRMDALEARYRAQFANLDTMMASMQRTSQYLTQQFANKSS